MTHRGGRICVCTPWRVYPLHTRSRREGRVGRGLLDLSHADKNCIMGLIGLRGPAWIFVIFHGCPGRVRERKRGRKGEYVRNDNQARRALSTSTDLLPFFALPPFLLSSLHSAFCSTAAKSIDPAGHARPVAAPHFHEEEGRGRGIHRSGNFRNKRKEQRRLSPPPPRLLFVTCRDSSIRPFFTSLSLPPSLLSDALASNLSCIFFYLEGNFNEEGRNIGIYEGTDRYVIGRWEGGGGIFFLQKRRDSRVTR